MEEVVAAIKNSDQPGRGIFPFRVDELLVSNLQLYTDLERRRTTQSKIQLKEHRSSPRQTETKLWKQRSAKKTPDPLTKGAEIRIDSENKKKHRSARSTTKKFTTIEL